MVILNERHEIWNVYACICSKCKHLDTENLSCPAFKEIPDKLLTLEMVTHDQPLPGQIGNTVFEAR